MLFWPIDFWTLLICRSLLSGAMAMNSAINNKIISITSPQFFVSCTRYQSASVFISRLPAVFSRHWPAKHTPTSLTTAAWYQTRTVADSALLTLELVSPPERLRDSVAEVSQLLVLKFATVYHAPALHAPDLMFDCFKRGLKTYLFTLVWWDGLSA